MDAEYPGSALTVLRGQFELGLGDDALQSGERSGASQESFRRQWAQPNKQGSGLRRGLRQAPILGGTGKPPEGAARGPRDPGRRPGARQR
jgi:hypothetical protein